MLFLGGSIQWSFLSRTHGGGDSIIKRGKLLNPLRPKQVRYQAALHPERVLLLAPARSYCQGERRGGRRELETGVKMRRVAEGGRVWQRKKKDY